MKNQEDRANSFIAIILAVVFIFGCGGKGFCTPPISSSRPTQFLITESNLTWQDSLIQEMVEVINPNNRIGRSDRKRIEARIKTFPHRILRRDTTAYFLQTAYAIAYYEFCKHDFKAALRYSNEFAENAIKPGVLNSIFDYASVVFNASGSIRQKGTIKEKTDKNNWYIFQKIGSNDSIFIYKRNAMLFIDSFMDDVPDNLDITTYDRLLQFYHENGGKLVWLNGYWNKGFFQKCRDARREDVFNLICSLWDVGINDFGFESTPGQYHYIDPTIKKIEIKFDPVLFNFNPDNNIAIMDSLVRVNKCDSIPSYLLYTLDLYYHRSQFHRLVSCCEKYIPFVNGHTRATVHDFWGLAASNLCNYEVSIAHYDEAINLSESEEDRSTIRLNKACTLAEMGRTDEALAIFMSENDNQNSAFNKFCWNDNIGYVYSFFDPKTALSYYNKAEKYLDTSSTYESRKIRHFCRKADVLSFNKFLQRQAVEQALAFTRNYSCNDIAKGMAYAKYGNFLQSIFDYKSADEYFKKASECYSVLSGEDYRVQSLNIDIANNHAKLGNHGTAISILEELLTLQRQLYSTSSERYLSTLRSLIMAYLSSPKASEEEKQSLFSQYLTFRDNSGITRNTYDDILVRAAFYNHTGKWNDALELLAEHATYDSFNPIQRINLISKIEEVSRNNVDDECYARLLSPFVDALRLNVVTTLLQLSSNERKSTQAPLLNLINGMIERNDFADALSLSLFRKGLLFYTHKLAEYRLAQKRATRKPYQELMSKRESLTEAISVDDTTRIPKLRAEIGRSERELCVKLISDKNLQRQLIKDTYDVRRNLSYNDVAFEFIRFLKNGNDEYGAFVVHKTSDPIFITIGTTAEIESQNNIVWNRLKPYLSANGNNYFCPDGILNNIGIEFLKDSDGVPMSQKYNLHRVFHLADIQNHGSIGNKVVAVGVSDHNSPIGKGETIDRGTMTDLPNVAYEMRLIKQRLNPDCLTIMFNDDASEIEFKHLDGTNLSSLHISTHGIYRDNASLEASAANPDDDDYHIAQRMLRADKESLSGLILRQGNMSWKSDRIIDDYDDILTAEEIENMSFPNLQLTILSACDSGLGDVDAEGVWGLQRAFRIAGSKSLICSLRKIDDYWSAQFMDAFYEYAGQGRTIYDSFHYAQRMLYEAEPDNPEIWSSFILIE